jgi:hypothetical protein
METNLLILLFSAVTCGIGVLVAVFQGLKSWRDIAIVSVAIFCLACALLTIVSAFYTILESF